MASGHLPASSRRPGIASYQRTPGRYHHQPNSLLRVAKPTAENPTLSTMVPGGGGRTCVMYSAASFTHDGSSLKNCISREVSPDGSGPTRVSTSSFGFLADEDDFVDAGHGGSEVFRLSMSAMIGRQKRNTKRVAAAPSSCVAWHYEQQRTCAQFIFLLVEFGSITGCPEFGY